MFEWDTGGKRYVIRQVSTEAEYHAIEELQREAWQFSDLDIVPAATMMATSHAGGCALGAFDGELMIGFAYGFPAFEDGRASLHSHMLAVKPAYRNYDLGRRLKLAQREHVIAQGIDLVSWTFDPLQSLNAHFNFGKLGVLADRYLPNFYGEDAASFLHQTGTDRLWVTWLVLSERVVSGGSYHVDVDPGPSLVQVETDDSPRRNSLSEGLALDHAFIEIPSNIDSLQREIALRWREETRWAFTEALNAGYYVDAFIRETRGDKRIGKYILRKGIWISK